MSVSVKNSQDKIPVNQQKIREIISKALSQEGVNKSAEITVYFVDDRRIRQLNLKYRGKDTPTDVLAFDLTERPGRIVADIVVSADTAIFNAGIFATTALYELYLYVIHGLLHITGYDDRTKKGRKIMDDKAVYILRKLKLSKDNLNADSRRCNADGRR